MIFYNHYPRLPILDGMTLSWQNKKLCDCIKRTAVAIQFSDHKKEFVILQILQYMLSLRIEDSCSTPYLANLLVWLRGRKCCTDCFIAECKQTSCTKFNIIGSSRKAHI